jgi:hypothetical protein
MDSRTAVPTGEVHRLPQKVRVFIDAAAQSQGIGRREKQN